jgi:hypothetical protein
MKFIEVTDVDGTEMLLNVERMDAVQIDSSRDERSKVAIRWAGGGIAEFVVDEEGYGQIRALMLLDA